LARPDFRAAAARRLSEERELSPAIVSLLTPDGPTRSVGVRIVPLDKIEPNPEQPRLAFNQETLDELSASIREHGVLQPILVRPIGPNTYQLIAGERRWRASKQAGLDTIPALIEDLRKKYGRFHYRRVDLKLPSQEEADRWMDAALWERTVGEAVQGTSTLDGMKWTFPSGWVLIRRSKTEPLLRIYFESEDASFVERISKEVA